METTQTHRPPAGAVRLRAADHGERLPRLVASVVICVLLIVVGATILISMVTGHG